MRYVCAWLALLGSKFVILERSGIAFASKARSIGWLR